jgi:hypothetical protein
VSRICRLAIIERLRRLPATGHLLIARLRD